MKRDRHRVVFKTHASMYLIVSPGSRVYPSLVGKYIILIGTFDATAAAGLYKIID